ncbi:hypothetical protein C8F04DRAFT_710019 [Mycena alexandri]|uniref:Secreted protein n=1 Tax=Mycena alexandri TaxID=1745969 RepID=A0AAD6SPW1_9AGAR|nr:hypothetical protein C8F04DRAFT_710019 [Mycena alexandri]
MPSKYIFLQLLVLQYLGLKICKHEQFFNISSVSPTFAHSDCLRDIIDLFYKGASIIGSRGKTARSASQTQRSASTSRMRLTRRLIPLCCGMLALKGISSSLYRRETRRPSESIGHIWMIEDS